jgi:hypothetical protein
MVEIGDFMIDKEAVLVLLRQILLARPGLRENIRSSRDFLFGVIARIYTLDELRREISFSKEDINTLFEALLEPEFVEIQEERLQRFFNQILVASKSLVKDDLFRSSVAEALLEAVKMKGIL